MKEVYFTAWPFSKHQVLHWPVARAVVLYFAQTKKDSKLSTSIRDAMVLACQGMRHFAVIISRAVIFSAFANTGGQTRGGSRVV